MASLLMLLPPVPIFLYLIILFILIHIPPYLSSDDNYANCTSSYDCGDINNIGFPFWGERRPEWCGHPLLQLNCVHGLTYIAIENVTYRVLEAKPDNHTLRIARTDYFQGLCPSKLVNTSLDQGLFVYGSENKNLTLFYNCHDSNGLPSIPGFFNCFPNGTSNQYFYAQFEALGPPPMICSTSVVVPYLYDIAEDWAKIQGAIQDGFFVRWIAGVDECEGCRRSGGACGYDWNSKQTITCYCRDQSSFPGFKTCPSPPSVNAPPQDDRVLPPSGMSKMHCQLTFSLFETNS